MKEVQIKVSVRPERIDRFHKGKYIIKDREIDIDFLTYDVLEHDDHIEGVVTLSGYWYKRNKEFTVTKIHN